MTTVANTEDAKRSDSFVLHKWQKCFFDLQSPESGPRVKVDAITGILQQIHQCHATGSITSDVTSDLVRHYIIHHSSIVESISSETGLNNYADGALTICANHPNESGEWTTSLTADSLKETPRVRQMIQSSKASAESRCHPRPDETFKLNHTGHCSKQSIVDSLNSTSLPGQCRSSGSGSMERPVHQSLPTPSGTVPTGRSSSFSSHPVGKNSSSRGLGAQESVGQGSSVRGQPLHIPTPYQSGHQRGNPPAPSLQERPGFLPPQDPSGKPHHPTPPAFASHVSVNRIHHHGQWNENQGARFNPEPVRPPGAPPHQGQRPSVFNSSAAPPHSLKRKTMFQEVEYQGDGQLPFRTSVPERAGAAGRKFNEGQCTRHWEEEDRPREPPGAFKTASEQLVIQNQKKFGNRGGSGGHGGGGAGGSGSSQGAAKKSLGTTRRGLNSKFVSPVMSREEQEAENQGSRGVAGRSGISEDGTDEVTDVRLKGIDAKMIELVMNEIMDHGPPIQWDDIAGLEFAKTTIKEIVVWPMLRPDIFNGLRGPPKGLLLFGPPGTGKTLIGKCIACQSGATFFSISASSLTSKWVGEGEKMVRALFAVARCHQPAVIFIDEIDSLLSQRSNDEHESSRRIKTEFLVQLDGATTAADDRLLVVGATNRPQEIDEAARRRLVKRLYIPLPEAHARRQIIQNLLAEQSYSLTEEELDRVCSETDGYSGADMANLCREAALGPIRCIQGTDIQHISADQVRPILYQDFHGALQHMRPSVSASDLNIYLEWNKTFGSGASK